MSRDQLVFALVVKVRAAKPFRQFCTSFVSWSLLTLWAAKETVAVIKQSINTRCNIEILWWMLEIFPVELFKRCPRTGDRRAVVRRRSFFEQPRPLPYFPSFTSPHHTSSSSLKKTLLQLVRLVVPCKGPLPGYGEVLNGSFGGEGDLRYGEVGGRGNPSSWG